MRSAIGINPDGGNPNGLSIPVDQSYSNRSMHFDYTGLTHNTPHTHRIETNPAGERPDSETDAPELSE